MASMRAMVAGAAVLFGSAAGSLQAQTISTANVATGLARPLYVTAPRGDSRLFVVEQFTSSTATPPSTGRVRVIVNGALQTTPFLSVTDVSTGDEQGLLGLAFHPDYANNGRFYISYTNAAGNSVIDEHTVSAGNANIADATRRRRILTFTQPAGNHNGGWIAFGPDGLLYVATGDGGAANDTAGAGNNAQNLGLLLGKMLRIDVGGYGPNDDADDFPADANANYRIPAGNPFLGVASVRPEIWSYGLRNPWRPSFDRLTGDLWIADVGQDVREEVNRQPAGVGGQNWGWRCWEGTRFTGLSGCVETGAGASPNTPPVFEYQHSGNILPLNNTGCSVTGGYVYRGCAIPGLYGRYLVADYCSGWVYAYNPSTATATLLSNQGFGVTSFGEDSAGELYITIRGSGSNGRVVRINPAVGTAARPCCPADYNRDGALNLDDLAEVITDYYTAQAIPGSRQPAAPQLNDVIVGFGRPCPNAADAAPPYDPAAFRRFGYRVGYSADGANACPLDPSQPFPNLDNLADYITLYYAQFGTAGC